MRTVLRIVCPRHGRVRGLIQDVGGGRLWLNENGRATQGEMLRLSDPGVTGVRCPRCRRGYMEIDFIDIQEAISEGRSELLVG
jgi:hypothetical protein